ncbi:MAG: type II toxin-antitoxin system VapC family toxin [Acidobacteria bacterium]|nr:type II toxin-antitoxin system VapC family toxin [Acidobacteriota bacterium]
MSLVLDCSVALAWIHADEKQAGLEAILERVVSKGAWVPGLWRLEVANVLEMGVRKGRIDAVFRDESIVDLSMLPIELGNETDGRAWGDTLELAIEHRLTVYDAAYLELALRRGLPLATLDRELAVAAVDCGVALAWSPGV